MQPANEVMPFTRRTFLEKTLGGGIALAVGFPAPATAAARDLGTQRRKGPVFVATWPFGKPANEKALEVIQRGGSLLDAVEQGIWVTESDITNSSVGVGGFPNNKGFVQLDACIMNGPGHKAGSVAALEGIKHPISAARRVMEKTRHVMLVGEGARQFALEQGLETADAVTPEMHKKWLEWKAEQDRKKAPNHDTIALVGLAADGTLAGGCSTSGLAFKLHGRVGDSPLIGSGLYVDNDIGAAGATGVGENILRYCGSFQVVEYMRQGASPAEACFETVKRIARKDPLGTDVSINFIAVDKRGRFGATGSGKGFQYSACCAAFSQVFDSLAVGPKSIGAIGGNRP